MQKMQAEEGQVQWIIPVPILRREVTGMRLRRVEQEGHGIGKVPAPLASYSKLKTKQLFATTRVRGREEQSWQ